jgi:hypothetical protein
MPYIGEKECIKIMAKNWKVGEAARAVQSGDKEATLDIGKRFPLFAVLVAQTNEAGLKLLDVVPDYVSARKIEMGLKGETEPATEDKDEDDEDKTPDEKKPAAKDKKPAKKAEEDDEDEGSDDEGEQDYSEMKAKELLALCEKRGIKVKDTYKGDKKYLAKQLEKYDAEAADGNDEDEEEEKSAKPKKDDKKPGKKEGSKKPSKKVEEDDEDDDDEEPTPKKGKKEEGKKSGKKGGKKDDDDEDWDV